MGLTVNMIAKFLEDENLDPYAREFLESIYWRKISEAMTQFDNPEESSIRILTFADDSE